MAVFMKNARIIGAGPLIVIDTDVEGCAQIEARIELLHIVYAGDRDTRVANLAVNIGSLVRIFAVQRD